MCPNPNCGSDPCLRRQAASGGMRMNKTITALPLLALVTAAQAQGLSPYYGQDGRAYRTAPDAATHVPQRAIPQQPYAVPQTVPAPTTPPPVPREQKVKLKPKPKAKPKPETPKQPVETAPEPTVAAPVTKPDPSSPPTEPKEIKPHPLAEWCGQEANAKAPLCRNVGSSRVQR